MRRASIVVVVSFVVLCLLAVPASAKAGGLPKVVKAYMSAIARATPAGSATAEKLAARDSNAATYAISTGGLHQATVDAGQPSPAFTLKFDDKKRTATTCTNGTPPVCTVFSRFKVVSARVTDFVRDGTPLTGQLSSGDGSSHEALGSALTLVGGYQTSSAYLIVSIAVKNGPNQLNFSYAGTYVAPDGHQLQSATTVAPGTDLRPGASATIAFTFPEVAPGGTVIVKCANQEPSETAETELPVPVFVPS